jgi:outer membrane protein
VRHAFAITASVLVLSLAPLAQAQTTSPTLEQLTAAALEASPQVLLARAGAVRAAAQADAARASTRGALRLQGQAGAGYNDFGAGYGSISPRTVALAYERPIWDGGAGRAGIAAAMAGQNAADHDLVAARVALRAAIAEAWIGLAVATGEMTCATALVEALMRLERDVRLQFEAGEVPRSALAEATARRTGAETMLEAARGGAEAARSQLEALTGVSVPQAGLPDTFPQIPPDLSAAQAQLANHPAIRAARSRIEAASHAVDVTSARSGPVAMAGVRAVHVRDEVLPGYRNDGLEAQVRISVPLWDGGSRSSAVASARADVQATEAARASLERQLADGLRRAWIGRTIAQARLRATGVGVEAARAALASMEAEFRVGERPVIDVIEARAALASAETDQAAARAAFILSHWAIAAALGQEGFAR